MGLTADDKFGFEMREVFTGETVTAFEKHYTTVDAHGCKIYRAKLIPAK